MLSIPPSLFPWSYDSCYNILAIEIGSGRRLSGHHFVYSRLHNLYALRVSLKVPGPLRPFVTDAAIAFHCYEWMHSLAFEVGHIWKLVLSGSPLRAKIYNFKFSGSRGRQSSSGSISSLGMGAYVYTCE